MLYFIYTKVIINQENIILQKFKMSYYKSEITVIINQELECFSIKEEC